MAKFVQMKQNATERVMVKIGGEKMVITFKRNRGLNILSFTADEKVIIKKEKLVIGKWISEDVKEQDSTD